MLKKRNIPTMDTIIGEHTTVIGSMESDSSIKICGRIEGDITSKGDVVVLENAVVKGDIRAENLIIAGTVNGNLYVNNTLHLEATARVKGDMELHSFITDEGAFFEGNCKMTGLSPNEDSNKKRNLEFKYSKPTSMVVEEKEC